MEIFSRRIGWTCSASICVSYKGVVQSRNTCCNCHFLIPRKSYWRCSWYYNAKHFFLNTRRRWIRRPSIWQTTFYFLSDITWQQHIENAIKRIQKSFPAEKINESTILLVDDDKKNIATAIKNGCRAFLFYPENPSKLFQDIPTLTWFENCWIHKYFFINFIWNIQGN